jgi:hypothetical protein
MSIYDLNRILYINEKYKKNVNGFSPEIMFTVFLTTFLYTAGKVDDYMSEGKECNSPFDCLSEFSTHGLNSQTHLP